MEFIDGVASGTLQKNNVVKFFMKNKLSNIFKLLLVWLGPGSTAALQLHSTWLHAAERRGSSDTRHSRYRDRARRFLMTFSLPAHA